MRSGFGSQGNKQHGVTSWDVFTDVASTIKHLLLAKESATAVHVVSIAEKWIASAQAIFAHRKHIDTWETALQKNKHSLNTIHISSYVVDSQTAINNHVAVETQDGCTTIKKHSL